MPLDYWVDGSCGFQQFYRHNESYYREYLKVRRGFMEKYCKGKSDGVWPFVHSVVPVKEFGEYRLDPLIVPLVLHMNTIEGVKTYSSCQGYARSAPYVEFLAKSVDSALKVWDMVCEWDRKNNEGYYWNECVVSLIGIDRNEEKCPRWTFQFYDTLALAKFTKEYLGVPVEKQIALVPESLRKDVAISDVPMGPPPEEWERAMTKKWETI